MKRIVWSWVGLVLGVLFVVGSVFALFDNTVTCGSETMKQGDVCVREKNGTVVSESNLDETRTDGTVGKIVGIGFGVAFIVLGAVNLRTGLRQRKAGAQGLGPAAVGGQPGLQHPVPGPWNQAPSGPQAWPHAQQPQYQQPHQQPHQQPQYQQPPQNGWPQQPAQQQGWQQQPTQQHDRQQPMQQPYPPSDQRGDAWR